MKQNIAVIGCGHWGKNLVRNFYELGALYAVCDPDEAIATYFSKQYKTKNLSYDEVLTDPKIKGVILAVPAKLHAQMAISAMKSGKNVFVEKPISMNIKDAELMIDVSTKEKMHLMVGHLLQYHPVFIKLKNIIKAGDLGKLSYIYSNRHSFGKVRAEEDVIWSFAPHDLSMILSLSKEEPTIVEAMRSSILQKNIADMATIHMTFNSGLKAHVSVSWVHPCKEQKLVVIGSDAMAIFDDTQSWDKKLAIYRHDIDSSFSPPKLIKADAEFISTDNFEPLREECIHFIKLINNKASPITDGYEGLRVLNVLNKASPMEK